MDYAKHLRRHFGESSILVDVPTRKKCTSHLLDFTRTMRGDEVTVIEIGKHGITVEYSKTGQKKIFPFKEIQIKEYPKYVF
ncbi:MAG: hypothetical protein PHP42_10575 [Bacteroidota bacterium]|nr:hypothetical protein [Bacteroidota bacterium]